MNVFKISIYYVLHMNNYLSAILMLSFFLKMYFNSIIESYLLLLILDPPASKSCSDALTFSLIHLWYTRMEVMDVPSKNTIPIESTDTLIAICTSFLC